MINYLYISSILLNIVMITVFYLSYRYHVNKLKATMNRMVALFTTMLEHQGYKEEDINNLVVGYLVSKIESGEL